MPAVGDRGDHALGWTKDLPNRYEIVREHGRGGMATVYLATDRKHDRPVALKVLAPELAAGIGVDRFLREIQIAAHLNHPHIVPLLDSGVVDGRPFYVMPFVDGESLRERLAREGPLPVDTALRIAHDVAEALACAHDHGVIHRDVKPGNVLLTGDAAVVTDFGIAAAVGRAPEQHLTRTGHSVGSVGYMSPEQAGGDEHVDARTDQYGLACVLFEMLTGDPPYTGSSMRAVLGRQLSQPVPAVSSMRDTVPNGLDPVLQRALARSPADRYPSMVDFASELRELGHRSDEHASPARLRTRHAIWAALGIAVVAAATAWLLPRADAAGNAASTVPVDTTRYAVFPFENRASEPGQVRESLRLQRALAGWEGLSIVPEFQLRDAMLRTGAPGLTTDQAAEVARNLGAGRFLTGGVVPDGDSVSIRTTLYATDGGGARPLAQDEIRLPRSAGLADSAVDTVFARHVVELLWHGDPPSGSRGRSGTSSMPAWRAFHFGLQEIERWNLTAADSGFSRATSIDPDYAEAHLWTALVRMWRGDEAATWVIPASQAARRLDQLSPLDSMVVEAVVLQAGGEFGPACPAWRRATERFPVDFVPWYGLGFCLRSDPVVVGERASPTGLAFRSSRREMIEAFEQAFLLFPAVLESFRADSYASLRRLLSISGHQVAFGRGSSPDTATYAAYPTWVGDTLAFPHRQVARSGEAVAEAEARQRTEAVDRQRAKFREIAAGWAANSPRSAAAREALAIGLAMSGDPAAVSVAGAARSLARSAEDSVRTAALEVWLRLAFGLPSNPDDLRAAGILADSLLDRASTYPRLEASLAALRGRGARMTEAMPTDSTMRALLPASLARDFSRFLAAAAIGGPTDSLARLAGDLETRVESSLGGDRRQIAYAWLGLPVSLAHSSVRLRLAEHIETDWLVDAQSALARNDSSTARGALTGAKVQRRGHDPSAFSFDALLPEAAVWMELGEPGEAASWIDPTLAVLPQIPGVLESPERTAALIRLVALRAEAAAALGNRREAALWARSVTILWEDADPFLEPLVRRMRELAE